MPMKKQMNLTTKTCWYDGHNIKSTWKTNFLL